MDKTMMTVQNTLQWRDVHTGTGTGNRETFSVVRTCPLAVLRLCYCLMLCARLSVAAQLLHDKLPFGDNKHTLNLEPWQELKLFMSCYKTWSISPLHLQQEAFQNKSQKHKKSGAELNKKIFGFFFVFCWHVHKMSFKTSAHLILA